MNEKLELMFNGIPVLRSKEELLDERAEHVSNRYDLKFHEIFDYARELADEFSASNGNIIIKANEENAPINIHELYKKRFASFSVINYELTQRGKFFLPISEGHIEVVSIFGTGETKLIKTDSFLKIKKVGRVKDVKYHEKTAMKCEGYLKIVEDAQQEYLSKIVNS